MKSSFRALLAGSVAAGALMVAGVAAAGSHPLLIVSNLDSYLQTQELIVAVPTNDPAIYKSTMYIGRGTTLVLRPGATFGEADADLMSNADYGKSIFQLFGDVIAVNPASYKNNTCAPGMHAAVWLARMTPLFLNVHINVPIYVDRAGPSEQSYASYVLKTCMPSPYDPFPGGAIFGGRLLDLQLYLTNFRHAGNTRWTTVVTPYHVNGGPFPEASGEAQAVVSQGSISTLTVKRTVKKNRKHKRYYAELSGRVTTTTGTGIPSDIAVYQLFSKEGGPEVAALRTDDQGNFSLRVRQKRTAFYGIVATEFGSLVKPPVCTPELNIGFGPLPCATLATSDFQSVRVSQKIHIPHGGKGIGAGRAKAFLQHRLAARAAGRLSP